MIRKIFVKIKKEINHFLDIKVKEDILFRDFIIGNIHYYLFILNNDDLVINNNLSKLLSLDIPLIWLKDENELECYGDYITSDCQKNYFIIIG